jgi:regulation of enolase protein 1 (concanavalin A-like superfamily)
MFRTLLVALLVPVVALAAPVPKAAGGKKLSETFGEQVNPDSTCKYEPAGKDGLRIVVPTTHPIEEVDHGKTVRPHMIRKVEGDFVLTVRIQHTYKPEAGKAEAAKQKTMVAAGIGFIDADDARNTFSVCHMNTKSGDKWTTSQLMQIMHRGGGSGSGSGGQPAAGKPAYLRVTRKGEEVKSEFSGDGKKWQNFSTMKMNTLGPAVNIGPVACQSTDAEYSAEFTEYDIKPLIEEPKK